ncbi:MAG: cardiolipin synthase [Lachnospiraceae bacterium]|nr:cardiolipin synthase [Lachnospiraceae bacterium]
MKKIKVLFRIVFGRTAFVVLFLLLQIGFLFSCFRWLSNYLVYIYGGMLALTALVVIYILNEKSNPSFKLAWVIPVLVIPVFGTFLYLFVQFQIGTKWINRRLKDAGDETSPYLEQNPITEKRLKKVSRDRANLAVYLKNCGGFPVCQNTSVRYFPLGDAMFPEFKRQLKSARKFIFMEYFIIERGKMWGEILEILEEKAAQGVEVRVMYDGMCCMMLLPYHYPQVLEKKGIRCKMFSPIKPTLSTHQNNRDHRKICVIDGHTAFTGGINLADEYINAVERFGHWKDTAVMLQGEGVQSFTMMFLQMWNITERQKENYGKYIYPGEELLNDAKPELGFVIPYGDSPLDGENVGERVYMDIINQARDYVHMMTPYLILDNEMVTALTFAAKRGVDTVLMMPHIPDKKYAYLLARSYYPELIEAGVKIYEYTPGFVHAKVFVSDDETAVVGTINLDFRSLYLHFECGVWIHKNPVVDAIEEDFLETLKKCRQVTLEDCRRYPFLPKFAGRMLRLIAPLM